MVEFSLHAWDSTSRTSPLWAPFTPLNDVVTRRVHVKFNSIYTILTFVTRYTSYTLFPTLEELRARRGGA